MEGAEVGSSSSLENYGYRKVHGSMPSPSAISNYEDYYEH